MSDSLDAIIAAIERYQPTQEGWLGLDELLERLWATGQPERGIGALLGIFERFPEEDGYGVFWSIVHGLESLPGYEPLVLESLRRQPGEFNVLLVMRILNAGQRIVEGIDLFRVLQEAANHPQCPQSIRQIIEGYVQRHHNDANQKSPS